MSTVVYDLAQRRGVVPHQDWEAARLELLAEEKSLTRVRAALAARRRRMPWAAVKTLYDFEESAGLS